MKLQLRSLVVAAAVAGSVSIAAPALAATVSSSPPQPAPSGAPNVTHPSQHPSILVSPIRGLVRLDGGTGSTATAYVQVQNTSVKPELVRTAPAAFTETTKGLMTAAAPGPMSKWLTASPASFTLRPGQIESVRITVKATFRDVGDHYLGYAFLLPMHKAGGHTTGASVSEAVESELIVVTPGKAVHATSFGLHAPSFSIGGSVPVTVSIANTGNVYSLANGLTVTDGPKPAAQFPGELVLAGAHTTATATWTTPPTFGFPAHLTLYSNGVAVATASVWIFPLYKALGALAILIALLAIWRIRRRMVNRRIDKEVSRRSA